MIKYYFILLCFIFQVVKLGSQDLAEMKVEIAGDYYDTIKVKSPDNKLTEVKIVKSVLYKKVDKMPIFYGCELDENPPECSKKKMIDFLFVNMKYPKQAKKLNIQGVVFAKFIVLPDGSIANPKIERGLGGGCDEEVLRFIQLIPKYTAGSLEGKPVPVQITLPVKFKLMK